MKLTDTMTLSGINASSTNHPPKSADDFLLMFVVEFSDITLKAREAFVAEVKATIPTMNASAAWGSHKTISFCVNEKDSSGYCKHLVDLFQNAEVPVTANSQKYGSHHPFIANSRIEGEIPKPLESFENFTNFLVQALARAEEKTSFQARLDNEPSSSKSPSV